MEEAHLMRVGPLGFRPDVLVFMWASFLWSGCFHIHLGAAPSQPRGSFLFIDAGNAATIAHQNDLSSYGQLPFSLRIQVASLIPYD